MDAHGTFQDTRVVTKIYYRTSFQELSLSLSLSVVAISGNFRESLFVTVVILTSRLALQKLRAILAKYIATAGRLIGEARLLKWFCEQKNVFFFRSIERRVAGTLRHRGLQISLAIRIDHGLTVNLQFAILWINNNNIITLLQYKISLLNYFKKHE